MNKKIAKLGEKTNLTKEDAQKFTKIGLSGLLALALSVFAAGWSNSNAAEVNPQPEKGKANPLSERCGLKPESGSCKAIFDKYYFDAGTNTCKTFIYGGCDGVVPFDTQEECTMACIGQNTERPTYPVSKYGGVSIRDFRNAK
ncbi:MAG: proteinase inhibitor I4 serpin [Syntrophus sp. (in: bacteria)]|nr:proteinase inhibitor I4 serpin [Syntrophus sp. (in: bacteria)]